MARPFLVPFRCLLWLAGSRWTYLTPPPHGFQSHVTTFTHNYFLRCATFTQLTIIHVLDYNHFLHWLTSQLSITVSNYHRLYIFTLRNCRRELTPRIHFLGLLINNWLVGLLLTNCLLHSHSGNWTKPANSFAYIAKLCWRYPSTDRTGHSTVLLCRVPRSCWSLTGWRLVSRQPRKHTWHSLTPEVWHIAAAWNSCLPVGYLATLRCVIQQRVDMSQYDCLYSASHSSIYERDAWVVC
jgi:hypothetical protein